MLLSVVIPVLNEAATLPLLLPRLRDVLRDQRWELIVVDDGSTDATAAILECAARSDERIKVLRFTRNFGHQAAVTAGLDFANGDAVIIMDADLQDPPELLPRMLALSNRDMTLSLRRGSPASLKPHSSGGPLQLSTRCCRISRAINARQMLETSACSAAGLWRPFALFASNTGICVE